MSQIFVRQVEATNFVAEISDSTTRLLTELALSRAISFLLGDEDYKQRFLAQPFDLLFFVRSVHALFQRKDVLSRVLSGDIRSIDDLDPFLQR